MDAPPARHLRRMSVKSRGSFDAKDCFRQLVLLTQKVMNLTIEIPDDVANRLRAGGGDLSRRALEALLAEEYKHGHVTKPDLRRVLGFETSDQIDAFLKAHNVWIDYTLDDLERERA